MISKLLAARRQRPSSVRALSFDEFCKQRCNRLVRQVGLFHQGFPPMEDHYVPSLGMMRDESDQVQLRRLDGERLRLFAEDQSDAGTGPKIDGTVGLGGGAGVANGE